MEENIVNILEYNTHSEKLVLPEYGRGIQKMVDRLKTIEDRSKRSEQARAVIKSMEILNTSIRSQENWERVLWDHLFIMADYDLDIDSPWPMPQRKENEKAPILIPVKKTPLKATHYGRNIESIIDLIAGTQEGEQKNEMIRDLALYMRTQYLIWNKDNVSEQTIFKDIEKLSDGRITVPEGLTLGEVSSQANFSRPGIKKPQGRSRNSKRQGRRPFRK